MTLRRAHGSSPCCRIEPLESRQLMASTIIGVVFSETDADGRREVGEAKLADQQVFLDTNFDGQRNAGEPTAATNHKGEYKFKNLTDGVWRVRLVVPDGFRQTSPGKLFYDIAANGDDIHAANDFGLTTTAVVRGAVFNDSNGDGVRQTTEQGIVGVLVYLDKNNNEKLDAGEKSRRTDATGGWRFAGLKAGKYPIRVDIPESIDVTTPERGFISIKVKKAQSLSNRLIGLH